ncbi:nuclease [Streptomyces sp. Ru71]|uniref:nuclease n=1 Tax=Streptomyces sp. Ru71 TaxID=2080746 RepID=UPI000CDE3EDC|nr:nuclease [Streptomyces sp. Ru71]POX56307.1 nuclease [Streptomyces sp. Ru71]
MPLLLIQGTYRLKGTKPDGDTVHFVADSPDEWKLVGGKHPVIASSSGDAPLRLEGIDALETHYAGVHQPLEFGHAAASELLSWLGFNSVERQRDEKVTASTPETVPGWILTGGGDVNNRAVALAGRGAPPAASGTAVVVDVPLLRQTANHHLASLGLVYPTFYAGLFPDLREELTDVARSARTAGQGLWSKDVTTSGFKVADLSTITDNAVILPKLFRRLVDYFQLGMPISCFPAFLAGKGDMLTVMATGERLVGLHHVVTVSNGHTVRLTHPVEDLLFDEG